MKKLFKLLSGVAFVFLLSFTLSSFTSSHSFVVPTVDNGVEVVIVKGGPYFLVSCDNGLIANEKNTQQYKNDQLHMRTTIYQLPEGDSCIPEKATKVSPYPGYTLNYTPSGKVIVKQIFN